MRTRPKRQRRLRATFLLQSVIVGGAMVLITALMTLGTKWALLGALLVFGLVSLDLGLGLLPNVVEWLVVRRAERSGKLVSSIWFVDKDREEIDAAHEVLDDSGQNPTIR